MNKKLYDRMGLKNKQSAVERKERRMYRKRIIALTCELLLNKDDNFQIENEDVVNSFRQYTKNCIQFFKATDENDLFQKELGTIPEQEEEEILHVEENNATFEENNATFEENNATFEENNATFEENNATFEENNATFEENNISLDKTNVDKTNVDKTNVDKTLSEEKVFKEVIMNPTTADYVKIDTMKLNASMDFYLNK
jgi:hypothetical protein